MTRTRETILVTIVLVFASALAFSRSKEETIYQHHRLEKVCPENGGKMQMSLKTGVSVFAFSSRFMEAEVFNCHLELTLDSASYGFSVFIEEMTMEGDLSGCGDDFIQFGRDILFVTSHRSKKYCGLVEAPVPREGEGVSGFNFPKTPLARRIYAEENDKEMDLWVRVSTPPIGARPKTLTLVVTPFKKSCGQQDLYYRQCRYSTKCIRKELFCDGRVNCAWPYSEPADEVYCKGDHPPKKTVWRFSNLPVIFVVAVIIIAALMLLYCGISKFTDRVRKFRESGLPDNCPTHVSLPIEGQQEYQQNLLREPATVADDDFRPSCPPLPLPLPPPPTYSEACLPATATAAAGSTGPPPTYTCHPKHSYASRMDDRQA